MKFAAIIYDKYNTIYRVEERPTYERAVKAGEFFTKGKSWDWYKVVETEDIEFWRNLINA